MQGKDGEALAQGYYGHVGYKITKKIEPIIRFDAFDPNVAVNTDKTNAAERDYIVGFNYFLDNHFWKIQTNYVRKTFTRDLVLPQNVIMTNLQVSW
jgi:hypothetical protein